MAHLLLTCLGDFQVTLGGAPLTAFPTDKVRALLVYLTVEGQVQQRPELAQCLWPGYTEASARQSLRQSLHRLRHLLPDAAATPGGAPWLLLTRQTVQCNPAAPICSDVATFRALIAQATAHAHPALAHCPACLARLRQAVDLYHGDFLAGFTLADSEPFEEWRRVLQEQLHLQMLDALTQLADAAEAVGDDEQALQDAQRQLALEPWLEAAHSRVMRLLARRGQRAAALAQYQRCRQVLAEEFGTGPDAATTVLYEQIQRGAFDKERGREGVGETLSPPHSSSPTPPPNLPVFPTPLVGRAQALVALAAHLQQPGGRLLTLVGPGGMGKTRLAVEAGREQVAAFADGVWFVPLAPLSTPDALAPAIATALGIALQGGDPRSVLLQLLRPKHLLLILDNFEHLLVAGTDAVDLVVDLLDAAPRVQIIVTSRERLKLRSEQLYAVPALPFSATATLGEATAAAAVRLFVQAVQRVQVGFQLTTTNLAAVLRICQLVQGMPLGLELAAANAGGAPLSAIADALEQSAEFLTVEWRDVPARQRSMRAVFAWSWQLLSAAEQGILRQSAVFRGGFTYSAAQAVTGATLPLLTRLTDKSLLQWQATPVRGSPWDGRGEGRYALHELLRQFAAEELHASGERALLEERHGRYYLAYLAARGLRLGRHEPKEASTEIRAELGNVRQAWQWAATQGRLAELEQATYAWWQFCLFQGWEVEGRQSFALAVEGVRQQVAQTMDEATVVSGQRLLAKLLAIHAEHLFAQGRDEEMAAQARAAIRLGAASGGVEGEAYGTFVLGRAIHELAQCREAGELWRQTIQLVRTYQPTHPESELLHDLHWRAHLWLRGSALYFGDYAGSRTYMVEALQLAQSLGKRQCELQSLACLGQTDFFLFDFARAAPSFSAALDLARPLGHRRVEMDAQDGLGVIAWLRGDYPTALTLLEEALKIATEFAFAYDEAMLLAKLIRLHCQLGNQAAAAQRSEQLTQLLRRVKLPKECQLAGYLAAALKAHDAGEAQVALQYAEQAHQLTEQGEILFRRVDTALLLGHTRAAVAQWAGAAAAFHQALAAFHQFGNRALAAEAQAGLAHIALAQGDLTSAQAHVEAMLPVLAEHPHAGYNNPFFIYLSCYHVLTAHGDPRAATLLQQAYDLLQQDAAALDDDSRHHFLTGVLIHRTLVAAYRAWRAQADRKTDGPADQKPSNPADGDWPHAGAL